MFQDIPDLVMSENTLDSLGTQPELYAAPSNDFNLDDLVHGYGNNLVSEKPLDVNQTGCLLWNGSTHNLIQGYPATDRQLIWNDAINQQGASLDSNVQASFYTTPENMIWPRIIELGDFAAPILEPQPILPLSDIEPQSTPIPSSMAKFESTDFALPIITRTHSTPSQPVVLSEVAEERRNQCASQPTPRPILPKGTVPPNHITPALKRSKKRKLSGSFTVEGIPGELCYSFTVLPVNGKRSRHGDTAEGAVTKWKRHKNPCQRCQDQKLSVSTVFIIY
jgi:hypothetical protein